jgi:heme/copper-type cytochrome/quinol oxidase subunit 2
MVGIFVLWGIFFTYLLIKYRKRDGIPAVREDHDETPAKISVPDSISKFPFAQLLYKNSGELKSLLPDLAVMVFEIALIVFYALPVWSRIKMAMPNEKEALVVEVVAEQFAWNIRYQGADAKFGRRTPQLVKDESKSKWIPTPWRQRSPCCSWGRGPRTFFKLARCNGTRAIGTGKIPCRRGRGRSTEPFAAA